MFYKNKEEVDQGKWTLDWAVRIWIYPEGTEQKRRVRCLDTFHFIPLLMYAIYLLPLHGVLGTVLDVGL